MSQYSYRGGSYGEGELIEGAKVVDYYNSGTGSWGLQAGTRSYGYAVFLMTDKAVRYVKDTRGWKIDIGPTIVVVDEGGREESFDVFAK